jgi:hypothetical protein
MQTPAAAAGDVTILSYLLASQQLMLLFVGLYFYFSFFIMVLGRKTSTSHTWLAWIPIANLFQLCRISRRSMVMGVLMLVPLVNLWAAGKVWTGVAGARGKPEWTGWLILIPGLNLLLPLYLAAGPVTDPEAAAAAAATAASEERPAFCPECGAAIEPDQRFCGECGFDVETIAPVVAAPAPAAASAAPQMVMRPAWHIAGIIAGIAVVALLGYVVYDSFRFGTPQRQMPPMPPALAGTLTEFPIDSTEMHPLQPDAVSTQQLGSTPLRVTPGGLPRGLQPSTITRNARALTTATYRPHPGQPAVTVTVLNTTGDARTAAQEIISEVAQASATSHAAIEVKSPSGQLYHGGRVRTEKEATYVLANDTAPSVVIVHASDPATLPAAERLAANIGNGAGLSAFPAVQETLGSLPASLPADLVLQEARTITSDELGRADAQMNEAAQSLGADAQRLAGQVHQMLPGQLTVARYQDAAKQDWAIVRGQYGSSPKSLIAWTILRSLMVMVKTETLPFAKGEARIFQSGGQRLALFRTGASLVMLAAPASATAAHLRQLLEGMP